MANPNPNPPVTASAAAHAERLRAREQRAAEVKPAAGQSTAQRIANKILPGYRADEELRERARQNELRARGVISVDTEPEGIEDEYEDEEVEEEPEVEEPKSTAQLYAEREMERQKHEHELYRAATRVWPRMPWNRRGGSGDPLLIFTACGIVPGCHLGGRAQSRYGYA
ncbi:hypothetical protein QA942_26300 [Streptomyces sp. B21-106]|uniref:hypothetical protein n=1 Tax=Streptomyces sp. B21-106 TaxID=3039418 RepID=UPI002FF1966D